MKTSPATSSRGGWLIPFVDEDFGAVVSSWFSQAGVILLGLYLCT